MSTDIVIPALAARRHPGAAWKLAGQVACPVPVPLW